MLEQELYDPVHDYLDLSFGDRLKPLYGELRHVSAITATAGGSGTGTWSKPDLCIIALTRPKYGPSWRLDVHGFEVKRAGNCNAQSVHEALNHTALVHYTNLVWHCERWDDREDACATVLERCAHFGVGLITFAKPKDPKTYVVRIPSRRYDPQADAVDEFIETRLPDAERAKLAAWLGELR